MTSRMCGGLLYPALKDVCCSGISMDWGRFCASNLRVLSLQNQPSEGVQIWRGILSNSKDTLDYLELSYAVGLDEDLGDPPTFGSRLILPHINQMKLVYVDPGEAQQILRAFDFPALRTITMKGHDEDDSSTVLVDVLKYVRVEELLDVMLAGISLSGTTEWGRGGIVTSDTLVPSPTDTRDSLSARVGVLLR